MNNIMQRQLVGYICVCVEVFMGDDTYVQSCGGCSVSWPEQFPQQLLLRQNACACLNLILKLIEKKDRCGVGDGKIALVIELDSKK